MTKKSIKEKIPDEQKRLAWEMGRTDFNKGIPRINSHSIDFDKTFFGYNFSGDIICELMKQWYKGWDDQNMKQSIPWSKEEYNKKRDHK